MYVCMYVCIMCVYVCVYVTLYVCVYVCVFKCTYVYVCLCVSLCMYVKCLSYRSSVLSIFNCLLNAKSLSLCIHISEWDTDFY